MIDKIKMFNNLSIKIFILIIIVVCSVLMTKLKFQVWNPISVVQGLATVKFSNTKIVELSSNTNVVLAKPNFSLLIEYMKNKGYDVVNEEQLGSMYVFYNFSTNSKIKVFYTQNKHYSFWYWN